MSLLRRRMMMQQQEEGESEMIDEIILERTLEEGTTEISIPFTEELVSKLKNCKWLYFTISLNPSESTGELTTLGNLDFGIYNTRHNYYKVYVIRGAQKVVPVLGISYANHAVICAEMPILENTFYVRAQFIAMIKNMNAVTATGVNTTSCNKNEFTTDDSFRFITSIPVGAESYIRIIGRR